MESCPECGAPLEGASACRTLFEGLLALEAEVPSAAGLPHFFAVSSYLLQHPRGMGLTASAWTALLDEVTRVLSGQRDLPALRRRVGARAAGAARVVRRPGEEAPRGGGGPFPATVRTVLDGGREGYAERVEGWARATVAALRP